MNIRSRRHADGRNVVSKSFSLDPGIVARLEAMSDREDVSKSALVGQALDLFLSRNTEAVRKSTGNLAILQEFPVTVWHSCGHADQVLATAETVDSVREENAGGACWACQEAERLSQEIAELRGRTEAYTELARQRAGQEGR